MKLLMIQALGFKSGASWRRYNFQEKYQQEMKSKLVRR